jgi:formylglycine-generating enzyme required for sulfatase activity
MICNKTISLRIFTWVIFPGLLLLSLIAASASADDKIGLDLEWRPITGVKKAPPPVPQKSRLYVDAEPGGAGIRILNIAPKFYQGMELTPGRYHVEVSARGFVTHREWVPVSGDGERRVAVSLRRISVKSEPARMRPVSPPPPARGEKVETVTVSGVSFKMVRIPAGEFRMGSPSGEPGRYSNEKQHRVRISKSFFLGETEVTQGLWRAVMGSNPSYFKNCGNNCPVEQVSWKDCQEFIRKLNRLVSGGGFRLPTEAEWEYACRGGTKGAYAEDLDAMGWYDGNSGSKTHAVATKQPNGWGLYDMHGNVWEWCRDWYGDYPTGLVTDPTGASSGSFRVLRGGSWYDLARLCRSANRYWSGPDYRIGILGFRLARF